VIVRPPKTTEGTPEESPHVHIKRLQAVEVPASDMDLVYAGYSFSLMMTREEFEKEFPK
jgi:hypothetical protein